jgi:hypothetical protein
MCRVLVSLRDNEVIHVIEDNEQFGKMEVTPVFGIIEIPKVSKGDFLAELRKDEDFAIEANERAITEKAQIDLKDQLASAKDEQEAKKILSAYLDKELGTQEFHYKLTNLSLRQRRELASGELRLSSVNQLTSAVSVETISRKPRLKELSK